MFVRVDGNRFAASQTEQSIESWRQEAHLCCPNSHMGWLYYMQILLKKEISPALFPDQQGEGFMCKWLKICTNGGMSKDQGGYVHFKDDQYQWLKAAWIFCLDINWNLLCRKPHLENTQWIIWNGSKKKLVIGSAHALLGTGVFILSQKANMHNPLQNKKSPRPQTFSLYTGRTSDCF